MDIFEIENEYLKERIKNNKKINFLDNLDTFGLSKKDKRKFMRFYWDNLELGLEEAFEQFKNYEK